MPVAYRHPARVAAAAHTIAKEKPAIRSSYFSNAAGAATPSLNMRDTSDIRITPSIGFFPTRPRTMNPSRISESDLLDRRTAGFIPEPLVCQPLIRQSGEDPLAPYTSFLDDTPKSDKANGK